MPTNRKTLPSALGASAILGLAPTTVVAQHVHGVIELGIVVEGDTVAVTMDAPLSDVIGFERAPENEEQEKMIEQAATLLSSADAMFGISESANCSVSATSIEGPAYITGQATADDDHDDHSDDHDHDHDHDHGHEHDHEHDGDHDEHGGHADIVANYEWTCGDASSIESLELKFADSFAGVETIEIQIITSSGAHVVTADRDTGSVSLSPP